MIRNYSGNKKNKNLAQGMVEFVLTIPIFLLLVFGIIEFSRLMFVYIAVTTASREAVRYGSAVGDNGSGVLRYMDCAGMRDAAKAIGQFAGITDDEILISYDTSDGTKYCQGEIDGVTEGEVKWGDRIVVSITNHFTVGALVPLIDFPPLPITSIARRTIMKGALIVKEDTAPEPTPDPNEKPKQAPNLIDYDPTTTPGGKCNNIEFEWTKNGNWIGEGTAYYFQQFGEPWELIPIVSNPINYFSSYTILNGSSAFFRLYADLGDGDVSDTLTFTLSCADGVLNLEGP